MLRALGALWPYRSIALGAAFSLIVVTLINLYTPQVLRIIIDGGITPGDIAVVRNWAFVLVGLAVARGVFAFGQGFWSESASQGMAYDLRNELFARINSLSFSYHDRAQTGQLMTRITSDVEQVRGFVAGGLLQAASAVVMLIGSVIALFAINWQLTLVVLLTVPAMGGVVLYFVRAVRPLFEQIQQRLGALNTVLQENLAGVRVVQAFAREPYEAQRYNALNEQLLEVNVTAVRRMASSFPLIFLISSIGTLLVTWLGGYQVIDGALTIGELVAFTSYLALLTQPLLLIGMIAAQITRAGVSARRVYEILDTQSEVTDKPDAQPLPAIRGAVRFEQVTFGYGVPGAGAPPARPAAGGAGMPGRGGSNDTLILKGVTFEAAPGMTIAIMGETGSGKSTIINLIPRFYDVTSGRVLVDDHDVRDITVESLREQIGIVLQDATLFSGTIRDNVAYGRPDASDADVEAAARAAQAHAFVAAFPDGYQTVIGERGVSLSGGQRQRIAIARALLRDPRILILDDSTSAVDAETEYQIQQALDVLMRGRTSFVIAQRISTVRAADRILLLDRGRIVAQGTHEELLATSALYGEIIDSQFGGVRATAIIA